MSVEEKFFAHLSGFDASPVLFIGSGVSRRYLGLEDWEGLLTRFAEMAGFPFAYYKSSCNGSLPCAAGKLAKDFHAKWWSDEKFAESRAANQKHCTRESSALKIEIAKYLTESSLKPVGDPALIEEAEHFRNAVFDGIITTNWDLFLESMFPDFVSYIGQGDIIFRNLHGVGEIFKIHGCCTDPNSLVLTDDDYSEFGSRYPYLTAKLLTIFVEHPIVFLGYSMSDENISAIVENIGKCLPPEKIDQLKDRLIFVKRAKGEDYVSEGIIKIGDISVPTKEFAVSSFVSVFRPMSALRRKFPAKLLRRLKEHVYDLVLSNDPAGKIYVQDIDEANDEKLEVVFGVGAINALQETGYVGVERYDLLRDILFDDKHFDANNVLTKTIPKIRNTRTYVPVFKYLRKAGRINADGTINVGGLHEAVVARTDVSVDDYRQLDTRDKIKGRMPEIEVGVREFYKKYGVRTFLSHVSKMRRNKINMDDLIEIMKAHYAEFFETDSPPQPYQSYFAKLICMVDWYINYKDPLKKAAK